MDAGGSASFGKVGPFQRCVRRLAGTRVMGVLLARVLHHIDGPILRLSRGRRSLTASLSGLPVIELTSLGARTGQEARVVPIVAVPDGDRLILVASNFGQHHHPGWYYNLIAHPRCSVACRGQRYEMLASEAEGEERLRLSELDHAFYPARSHYARRATGRRLPVAGDDPGAGVVAASGAA